jgi:hypothetical protein
MAAINGTRQNGALDPPPSSILATRIASHASVPELNQVSFEQLLAESLGNDENGQPNLGSDININLKVVEIVLKAGIEPTLVPRNDDPFAGNPSREAESRFLSCLQVIKTAVERSPKVLFGDTATDGSGSSMRPLYSLLIPKLFSAYIPGSSPERKAALEQALITCIRGQGHPGVQALRLAMLDFTIGCMTGKCSKPVGQI